MSHNVEHVKRNTFKKIFLSLPVQLTVVAFLAGIVLYTTLFSGYSPIHDTLHELRHSLMFIPCH
jgi:cobalt transporter subunit CbtB